MYGRRFGAEWGGVITKATKARAGCLNYDVQKQELKAGAARARAQAKACGLTLQYFRATCCSLFLYDY